MSKETTSKERFSYANHHEAGQDVPPAIKFPKKALDKAILKQKRQTERIALVRKLVRSKVGVFQKAYKGRSLRAAINANCLDCMGYEQAEVKRCEIYDCAFHSLRPYQPRGGQQW